MKRMFSSAALAFAVLAAAQAAQEKREQDAPSPQIPARPVKTQEPPPFAAYNMGGNRSERRAARKHR